MAGGGRLRALLAGGACVDCTQALLQRRVAVVVHVVETVVGEGGGGGGRLRALLAGGACVDCTQALLQRRVAVVVHGVETVVGVVD